MLEVAAWVGFLLQSVYFLYGVQQIHSLLLQVCIRPIKEENVLLINYLARLESDL